MLDYIREIFLDPKRKGMPFNVARDEVVFEIEAKTRQYIQGILADMTVSKNISEVRRKVEKYQDDLEPRD